MLQRGDLKRIGNKQKRNEIFHKLKSLKGRTKFERRRAQRRFERENPEEGERRRRENVPDTIDGKRIPEDSEVGRPVDSLPPKVSGEDSESDSDVEGEESGNENDDGGEEEKSEEGGGNDPSIEEDEVLLEEKQGTWRHPTTTTNNPIHTVSDEFQEYFQLKRHPKILVTTSKNPKAQVLDFAQEFTSIFPDAHFVKRGNLVDMG